MGKLAIKAVIIATLLFVCAGHPAYAAPPEERWVVLAARQDQAEPVDLSRIYARSVDGVRVARAKNGWLAILAGPIFAKTIAEAHAALTARLYIPGDSYLGRMDGFLEVVFEAPPSPIRATGEYRSGDPPAVTRFKSLTVVLDIPGSGENPKISWVDDPEVVGNLVAVDMPVPGHFFAQHAVGVPVLHPDLTRRLLAGLVAGGQVVVAARPVAIDQGGHGGCLRSGSRCTCRPDISDRA